MAKTVRVHAHCGARIVGENYCPRCSKWVVGDGSMVRVRRFKGRGTAPLPE